MKTPNLAPGWPKGQSGNPDGRPKGPSLRTRLRKLDDEAFEALRSCLVAKSRAIRLRAYEVWSDLRMRTAPPKELRAGRQMLEGEFTEAQYLAMEEHAKLMAKNEAGE